MYNHLRIITALLPGLLMSLGACSGADPDDDSGELESALSWKSPRWVPLGGNVNPDPNKRLAYRSSLEADPRIYPVVAFNQEDKIVGRQILVFRWTGNHWFPLGEPIKGENPVIRIGKSHRLYLCARGTNTNDGLFVKRWNGSRWIGVGGDVAAEIGRPYPSANGYWGVTCNMVLDGDDRPTISWEIWANGVTRPEDVILNHIARWNDDCQKWEGMPLPPLGIETVVALGIDTKERLYALSRQTFDEAYERDNHVWIWGGHAWRQLGATIVSHNSPSSFAVHGDIPYLAINKWKGIPDDFSSDYTRVVRWDHHGWRDLPSPGKGRSLVLKISASGTPVLAYSDWLGGRSHVKYFAEDAWHEIGSPPPGNLELALDAHGRPLVTGRGVFVERYSRPVP